MTSKLVIGKLYYAIMRCDRDCNIPKLEIVKQIRLMELKAAKRYANDEELLVHCEFQIKDSSDTIRSTWFVPEQKFKNDKDVFLTEKEALEELRSRRLENVQITRNKLQEQQRLLEEAHQQLKVL